MVGSSDSSGVSSSLNIGVGGCVLKSSIGGDDGTCSMMGGVVRVSVTAFGSAFVDAPFCKFGEENGSGGSSGESVVCSPASVEGA